jgi:hypothetical protein
MKNLIISILLFFTFSVNSKAGWYDTGAVKNAGLVDLVPCAISYAATFMFVSNNQISIGTAGCAISLAGRYIYAKQLDGRSIKENNKEINDRIAYNTVKLVSENQRRDEKYRRYREVIRMAIAKKLAALDSRVDNRLKSYINSRPFKRKISNMVTLELRRHKSSRPVPARVVADKIVNKAIKDQKKSK